MEPSAFVRALPKVQLHCHLEGTVAAATFRELANVHGVGIGARGSVPLEETYAFASFREFLLTFADVCRTLRTPDDFARIAREYAQDARAQNVRYAELFVSPSVWTYFHRGLDVRSVVRALRGEFDAAARDGGPEVRLICDLTRNFGLERAAATARQAVELAEFGVIGIGLGGDEANFPPELYAEPFAFGRAHGLRTVVHAGEAAGAGSVRNAIEVLGAERIGHGVRALEDDALVDDLARRGIALELCPTSNRLTGAVAPGAAHPIGELDRRGVVCVIDADDPALFSTTLSAEYALVERQLGATAVARFARQAVESSFAPADLKSRLRAEMRSATRNYSPDQEP
jgi:adenosine deaminase